MSACAQRGFILEAVRGVNWMLQSKSEQIEFPFCRSLKFEWAGFSRDGARERFALRNRRFKQTYKNQSMETGRSFDVARNRVAESKVAIFCCAIGRSRHRLQRQLCQLSKGLRRNSQQISKSAGERAHAVVTNVITDINHLAARLHKQAFCPLQAQGIKELRRRNACYLAKGAIEVIAAGKGDPGHGSERQRLVNLVSHRIDDSPNGFIVRAHGRIAND